MAEQPLPSLPFHHEPLPSKSSIRLVSLVHDASGDLPPMVQGVPLIRLSLTTVDLKDNPYYDTLSYTWGSPFWEGSDKSKFYHGAGSLRPVAVNNRIYYIGRNPWEFLHQAKQTISNPRHHPNPDVEKRYKKYNKTAIIIAAENGRLHRVKKYIRLGADLGAQDKFGETALHYAAENGHLDIVKLLVNHGSDINLRDSTSRTPLDCAIQRERGAFKEVIDFLQNAKDFPQSRNLRKDLPLSDRCPLWIDSICIDQGNISERNAQVAMMSEIYSHAESVIVWLEVEDEYAAPAFEAIEKIEEESTEKSPSFMAWLTYIYTGSTAIFDAEVVAANILASLNYPRKIVKDGVAISHLLERTWWSRVWIVQELALSKEVLMVCGSLQIDFLDTFVFQLPTFRVPDSFTDLVGSPSVVYALQAARFADVRGIEACVLSEIKLRKSADKDKSQWVSPNGNELLSITPIPHDENKLSIQVLGTMTRWFQASDPRDHVFALLGIAGRGGKDHGIVADYSMTTAELFVKYGRLFMQGSPDEPVKSLHTTELYTFECLEGLSYVQTNPKPHPRFQDYKTRLPSWTPNFSVPLVTHRIWSDRFNPSPALPGTPIILPSAATDELRLNGAKYDEVVAIEPLRKEYGDYHILLTLAWLQFILPLHPIYVGGGNRIDALWRTLTANRVQGAATSKRVGFRDFMRRNLWYAATDSQCAPLVHSLLLQLRQADSRDTLPAVEEIEAPPVPVRKKSKLYLDLNATFPSAWRRYYASRCLYRTKRGYIGLGPEETNPGDEVWLIAGARTPFILQKPGKKKRMKRKWLVSLRSSFHTKQPGSRGHGDAEYREFVGESYVHGLMDGEAAEYRLEWLSKIITDADNHPSTNIHPVLGEFKRLIESDSTVNSLFGSVFQDLPFKRFSSDIVGLLPKTSPTPIRDYKHFLQVLNRLLTTAPTWVEAPNRVGVVGMPLTAILDWPLNASNGLSLFKNPAVAQILKKVLDAWGEFLKSPQSATVLDNSPTGWFGETGLKALTDAANVGGTNYAFDQVYQCDSSKKHYGFRSWDDFFTRSFREGMRPVAEPDNGNVIVSPCEAKPYKITHGVDNNDNIDLKGSQQSISKMLDDEHLAQQFVGGTVYQAYLGVLDYHHWHAPVSGRVVKNYVVEGAQGPPSSDSFISNIPGSNLWGSAVSDPAAADFTATATRGVVTIDTGNPAIGHVGVVFVGMADISSVEFSVDEGQHVSKGSELGMFHYGGSNHCLVFQNGVNLSWQVNPAPETPITINQHLAVVSRLQRWCCKVTRRYA